MLSGDQLENLVTGLQSSAPFDDAGLKLDPEWIRDARATYVGKVQNALINIMVDQASDGTTGLGGTRGRNAGPSILGFRQSQVAQVVINYLGTRGAQERASVAEEFSSQVKAANDRLFNSVVSKHDSQIIAGDSRYYRIDDGLAVALQRDLSGSMPWIEFGSKVNGCRTIRFLGQGESLANAWAHALQFGVYLLKSRKSQKADNASAPKEQSADAFSKQVETFLASVPVDKRYEVIHRKGRSFLKSLQLLGL